MNLQIRPMTQEDSAPVLEMMRVFYTSPAVWSNGSEEIFEADFHACISVVRIWKDTFLKTQEIFRAMRW